MTRKTQKNDAFLRVMLATLPILPFVSNARAGLFLGLFAAVTSVVTKKFPVWLTVIFCTAFAQAGWTFLRLVPIWILSAFLLSVEKNSKMMWAEAVCLFSVSCLLGLSVEMLAGKLGIAVFNHPAGLFLLLAGLAFLWQNQPGEKA